MLISTFKTLQLAFSPISSQIQRAIRTLMPTKTRSYITYWPIPRTHNDTKGSSFSAVKVVIFSPRLKFSGNNFLGGFAQSLLDFPGANDVPLGSLHLQGNKVLNISAVLLLHPLTSCLLFLRHFAPSTPC